MLVSRDKSDSEFDCPPDSDRVSDTASTSIVEARDSVRGDSRTGSAGFGLDMIFARYEDILSRSTCLTVLRKSASTSMSAVNFFGFPSWRHF